MSLIIVTAILVLLFNDFACSQNEIIQIWNEKIPGALIDNTIIEDTIIVRGSRRIRKVTVPDLTIFLPNENTTRAAVLICPGGGYERIAVDPEGIDIAHWLNKLGIAAFVLKYRLPDKRIMKDKSFGPLQDVQKALRLIRQKAEEFDISPGKIGIIGFSAGGHLASTLSVHYDRDIYDSGNTTSAKPDFVILIYPVISMNSKITHDGTRRFLLGNNPSKELVDFFSNELHVGKDTPPTFIVHSSDDKTVPVQNSIVYFSALKKNDVPVELHIYEKGGHGYGLGRQGGTESNWPATCEKWLEAGGFKK